MQWASKNEARTKWLCPPLHWKDLNGAFLLAALLLGWSCPNAKQDILQNETPATLNNICANTPFLVHRRDWEET